MVRQKGWIADRLRSGHKFKVGNITWKLSGSRISEAEYTNFSRAVYECKLVDKIKGVSSPAIVKIWMQTKEETPNSADDRNLDSTSESEEEFQPWQDELDALNILNKTYDKKMNSAKVPKEMETGFKPFPQPIGLTVTKQEKNFPVEGGYLAYLVIEKLPGKCIPSFDFWGGWDKRERDAFRAAFMESAAVIQQLGVENKDKKMENLLYDEDSKRCYFIDWEAWGYIKVNKPWGSGSLQFAYDMIRDLGPQARDNRWDRS